MSNSGPAKPSAAETPLVVDLDGTLIRTDLLLETALLFVRDRPFEILKPLGWLKDGKANLKQQLAEATNIDASLLPYNLDVIELIKKARGSGREVILATASNKKLACQVAEHLDLFDSVMATESNLNLSGSAKRDALEGRYGKFGFDYVGNSGADIVVWESSRTAHIVNASSRTERAATASLAGMNRIPNITSSKGNTWAHWIKALRLHQWSKNLLIFVPLFAAHQFSDLRLIFDAMLAFLCFGLIASSVYILNDLLDLRDDRRHTKKQHRPFAAGTLPIQSGLLALPLLWGSGFGIALFLLPQNFGLILGAYYCLTLAYSLVLKRRMVIDVITLASLYTIRIISGAFAINVSLTFWLLAFSMFFFLSLAFIKRYTELSQLRIDTVNAIVPGRGYRVDDLPIIGAMGAASGYLSVMVLALYINSPDTKVLYNHPEFIWLACPLLLTWVSRVWMLAHRGRMDEDPVFFALRDRFSLIVVALLGIVFGLAL